MVRLAVALVVVGLSSGCGLARDGLGGDPISLEGEDTRPSAIDTALSADTASEDTSSPPDTLVADTTTVGDTTVVDTLEADVAAPCTEPDSVVWSGHCYFPLPAARDFNAQRDACFAKGAHLASITSAEEQTVVAARGSGDRWIGLLKDPSLPSAKSSFRWISGESADVYDNWSPGDPNGGHNCARMMAAGAWGDQACTTAFPAVCERE